MNPRTLQRLALLQPLGWLQLKFREGVQLPYANGPGLQAAFAGVYGKDSADLVAAFPDLVLTTHFRLPATRIQALIDRAEGAPGYQDEGTLRWYQLHTPQESDLAAILVELNGAAWAQVVERAERAFGGIITPTRLVTREDETNGLDQLYLTAAKVGVDAEYAWGIEDGAGNGIHIADVEMGWDTSHADLQVPPGVKLTEIPDFYSYSKEANHGTQVLGILVAADNGAHVVGLAPNAPELGLCSLYSEEPSSPGPSSTPVASSADNPADAIQRAAEWLSAKHPNGGGILLVELAQAATAEVDGTLEVLAEGVPLEIRADVHEQIKLASAAGHLVVAAAGNAGIPLDAIDFTTAGSGTIDFVTNDSGSLLVGASDPVVDTSVTPYVATDISAERWGKSCYGDRVDCFAWGDHVRTTGMAGPISVSSIFSDTSAASAIVAGAAALLRGLSETHTSGLTVSELRDLLRDDSLGTPSSTAASEPIGVMPDLRAILQLSSAFAPANLFPDVYIRDHVGDTGAPHTGSISSSPDVIVIPYASKPAVTPQEAYGETSPDRDTSDLSEPVVHGETHLIYVRALNRGKAWARRVEAKIYWAEVATLLTPASWNYIGTATFPDPVGVERGDPVGGDTLWVSDPIEWKVTIASGHYCFVAILDAEDDAAPSTAAIADMTAFKDFIRNQNNATWRNFNVVDLPESADGISFPPEPPPAPPLGPGDDPPPPPAAETMLLRGHDREALPFDFAVEVLAPKGVTAELELSRDLFDRLGLRRATRPGLLDGRLNVRIDVEVGRAMRLGEATLEAGEALGVVIRLSGLARATIREPFEVVLRQHYDGQEVGRVTWLCRPS